MLIQAEGYYPLRIYDTGGTVVVQSNVWNACESVPLLDFRRTLLPDGKGMRLLTEKRFQTRMRSEKNLEKAEFLFCIFVDRKHGADRTVNA